MAKIHGKIEPLDNRQLHNVPKAEPRSLLSSNNDVMRGSVLGFDEEPPTEVLLDQLAEFIVKVYYNDRDSQ